MNSLTNSADVTLDVSMGRRESLQVDKPFTTVFSGRGYLGRYTSMKTVL
jgi:hypothetical protein